MEILESKTDQEIIASILAESAKSTNELLCAKRDLDKASNRQSFIIVLINELKRRHIDH